MPGKDISRFSENDAAAAQEFYEPLFRYDATLTKELYEPEP